MKYANGREATVGDMVRRSDPRDFQYVGKIMALNHSTPGKYDCCWCAVTESSETDPATNEVPATWFVDEINRLVAIDVIGGAVLPPPMPPPMHGGAVLRLVQQTGWRSDGIMAGGDSDSRGNS
jgi:hypothetical protein